MFNSDEFLGPAEKMPLLFQAAHLHVLKTTYCPDDFTSIVKNSQVLMTSSCSMLWQIHRTYENMASMFSSLLDAISSKQAAISSAIAKEISEWIEQLVKEVDKIKERWSKFDVKYHAEWKKAKERKDNAVAREQSLDVDLMFEECMDANPDLLTNLRMISQCLGQAGVVLQEIIHFLDKVGSELQERKQEWRKILILLNSQDPSSGKNVKMAEENWKRFSSGCKEVKTQLEEKQINQLYNKVLYGDPRDLTKEQWASQEAACLARVNDIEKLTSK